MGGQKSDIYIGAPRSHTLNRYGRLPLLSDYAYGIIEARL